MNGQTMNFDNYYKYLSTMEAPIMPSALPKRKINFSNLRIVPEESSLKLNITSNFSLDPGQEMELIGTMTPTTVGYQNCKIVMDTDHPDFKTLSISAYGTAVASPYFQNEKK